jgi:superfamily II DNA or RNA helicase
MTKVCTINVDDEVNTRIAGLSPADVAFLYDKLGVFVEGYRHMPQYQLRRWDGKVHFFDNKGNTYTKLLEEILPYVASWGYDINLVDSRPPAPVIVDRVDEHFFGLDHFKLRPYQVDVVNALLEEGSGFAICATGAGKTSMCAALAMMLYLNKLQTIIIVPSSDLVTQTVDELKEKLELFPVSIGSYSGSSKEIDNPIVVATWQSLQNAPQYMQYFNAFIVDEAHGLKANVIKDLVNVHGKHISHRYGVTGTFPKGQADAYNLKLSVGRILKEVPASWLIEQGYLSEIDIEPVMTQDIDPELPDYSSEKGYLAKNDDRLNALAQSIKEWRDQYGNTMVLVNSIAQGQLLQELIDGSVFLSGSSGKDERKENYDHYADQDGLIVIATFGIASTGISIDRIFCLVLIEAGKSFVRAIQSVGRGLRKKGDKNKVFVKDVASKLQFSKKHQKERLKYYKEAGYPTSPVLKLKYSPAGGKYFV